MSSKKQTVKIQDDSIGSDANRQPQSNMVDASLLSDYIAALKDQIAVLKGESATLKEQLKEKDALIRRLIDKRRELSEQCNESTGRSNGKHLLS